jgi:hypothetical protein
MAKYNQELFQKAAGIKLDIGAGLFKQKGFIGLDIMNHPNIDIVHDIQTFPWPVPDNICSQILMSHIWEHIEPKYRFEVMDELWRICRYDGQLFICCPHAGSYLESAHPAHYMCPNVGTFQFFDPDFHFWQACSYKKPLPWKIIRNDVNVTGTIEVILEPRKDSEGKSIISINNEAMPDDVVKVITKDKDRQANAGKPDNNNQKR